MAPKFFHIPKPKQFTYRPHYYDERKEELYRLKKKHGIIDGDTQGYKYELRDKLQRNWRKRSADARREKSSTIRLIIILIVLLGLTYYFLLR